MSGRVQLQPLDGLRAPLGLMLRDLRPPVAAGLRHNGAEKLPFLVSLACGRFDFVKLTPPPPEAHEECDKWKSTSPVFIWCCRTFHSPRTLLALESGQGPPWSNPSVFFPRTLLTDKGIGCGTR